MPVGGLTDHEYFFYLHAGYSYDPKTETAEEGRVRCARDLAAAETRLKDGPYFTTVEDDDLPWDGDEPYDGPIYVVTLYRYAAYHGDDEIIGSLGGVDCESVDDPYIRVVAAELALEHIPADDLASLLSKQNARMRDLDLEED